MKFDDGTEKIIGVFYDVYNELGFGFLESVYEKAMMVELGRLGIRYENQVPIKVNYKGVVVGDYKADLIVDGNVLIEIKAKREMSSVDEAQLLNYLKATGIKVGLLINFGEKAEFKRRVY